MWRDSPAHKCGIRSGDQIVAVDSHRINTVEEARQHIAAGQPGSRLKLLVRRGKNEMEMALAREARSPGKWSNHQESHEGSPSNVTNEPVRISSGQFVVIEPYVAKGPLEMSLNVGDVVLVQRKHEKGFWEGCVVSDHQRRGWFPSSVVQPLSSAVHSVPNSQLDVHDSKHRPERQAAPTTEDGAVAPFATRPEVDPRWRAESLRLARKATRLIASIHQVLPEVIHLTLLSHPAIPLSLLLSNSILHAPQQCRHYVRGHFECLPSRP